MRRNAMILMGIRMVSSGMGKQHDKAIHPIAGFGHSSIWVKHISFFRIGSTTASMKKSGRKTIYGCLL